MKSRNLLTTLALVSVVLAAGCKKDNLILQSPGHNKSENSNQIFVDLKTAARFGILGATAITSVGPGIINNFDVGISPRIRASITGFPPALLINGAIYGSDDMFPSGTSVMLAQAKQDLTDAYLFAEAAVLSAPFKTERE